MSLPKIAISSNSLGKSQAGHDIFRKMEVANFHGFEGMELAFECLELHSKTLANDANISSREDRLRAAARSIYEKSVALSLPLIALNPFGAYDGLITAAEIDVRLQEAKLWCQLCEILHIPILQVCEHEEICLSSTLCVLRRLKTTSCLYPMNESRITPDPKQIAHNMRKLGLLAQRYNMIVAYEAPAWGIHLDTWEQIHEIITLVNLPNVKHCLDTFHIAARVAGDPFNHTSPVRPNGLSALHTSLDQMKRLIHPDQIGYLQLSDATVADREQKGYPVPNMKQPTFMTQSRNCRIYPCEPAKYGGTLPALDVAKTVFALGYRGWVSMEVFHVDLWDRRPSYVCPSFHLFRDLLIFCVVYKFNG
jgi:4-hydroxyphenylpyruvate dioxygenase